MKKLLGIVVLGLLLSGNAYAFLGLMGGPYINDNPRAEYRILGEYYIVIDRDKKNKKFEKVKSKAIKFCRDQDRGGSNKI